MSGRISELYYVLLKKIRARLGRETFDGRKKYMGIPCVNEDGMNKILYDKILSSEPFMACRFGATELNAMRSAEFNNGRNLLVSAKNMSEMSGFFPEDYRLLHKFNDLMKRDCADADYMGLWFLATEEYFLKKYCRNVKNVGTLMSLEPWYGKEYPWSSALKGKKVLVIHPFEDTLKAQYAKREKLFKNQNLLPDFTLITLKAIQTSGSATDDRFETWFDALSYMRGECEKIDFDIALIGCGAYGFPLAAHIKRMGKQAIHLGGVLQILFGIKGRRWDESDTHLMYNEHWVYPDKSEIPVGADKIENACYWEVKGNAAAEGSAEAEDNVESK